MRTPQAVVESDHSAAIRTEAEFGWFYDTPWWAVSTVLHGLLLLLIGGVVLTTTDKKREKKTSSHLVLRDIDHDQLVDEADTAMDDRKEWLRESVKPLVKQAIPEKIVVDIPSSMQLNDGHSNHLKHVDTFDVIGIGSGMAGDFSHRLGHGTLVKYGGGGKNTENAVRRALNWLHRHQSPDGRWSCRDFVKQCSPGKAPCTNLNENPDYLNTGGRGWKEHDIGVTALAILAYTGFGYTHETGPDLRYAETVRQALGFLKSVQIAGINDPNYDGCFRFRHTIPKDKSKEEEIDEKQGWMYDHAIATMAVSELLLMSQDFIHLKKTVEDAAMFCIRAQNEGWGWRYSVKSPHNDTSITGWMVLALKTAKVCRDLELISRPSKAEFERSFAGALHWFDHATSNTTGITGYRSPGDEGSRLFELDALEEGYPYSKTLSCMTAVGVLCRLFAGEKRIDPLLKRSVGSLMRHLPEWRKKTHDRRSTINFYYWYYGTFAMFQFGGRYWHRWNEAMQESLLKSQRKKGDAPGGGSCEHGSWDPIGEWGAVGGRVYATAMGALTLEVYYRYKRATGER